MKNQGCKSNGKFFVFNNHFPSFGTGLHRKEVKLIDVAMPGQSIGMLTSHEFTFYTQ